MATITVCGLQFNVWEQSFRLAEPAMSGPVIWVGKNVDKMRAIKAVARTVLAAMECQHNTAVAALEGVRPV